MLKGVCPALVLLVAGCGLAAAAPQHLPLESKLPVTLAANGCGPAFFRTITGECVPNARVRVGPGRAVVLPPPCPRGYRRDPDPSRPLCYPVF